MRTAGRDGYWSEYVDLHVSRPGCRCCRGRHRIFSRGHVAGNLPRPVAGDGPDRAGDQRVRRRSVAQNSPAAVADDLVSGIVEKSHAVRLEINPVSTTRLDNRGSVSVSDIHGAVLHEDGTVNVGNGDGTAIIQSSGGNGIYLKTNSVGFFNNAGNQIVSNSGWGILCYGPPANPLIAGTIGTVSSNGAGQISCNMAP